MQVEALHKRPCDEANPCTNCRTDWTEIRPDHSAGGSHANLALFGIGLGLLIHLILSLFGLLLLLRELGKALHGLSLHLLLQSDQSVGHGLIPLSQAGKAHTARHDLLL